MLRPRSVEWLQLCLRRAGETNLRAAIGGGALEDGIERLIRRVVAFNRWSHDIPTGAAADAAQYVGDGE